MNQFKNKTLFILLALIFVLSAFASNAKTQCPAKTAGECVVVEATAQTASPYLAQGFSTYLDNLYQYLLGMVGIAALGAMVYGGVLYITAAANPSKMGEAKKWITNAIYGLLLAAFSYVLLYTINPDLVGGFTNLNLNNYLGGGGGQQQQQQQQQQQPITCPGGSATGLPMGWQCLNFGQVPSACKWSGQAPCSSYCQGTCVFQ